jgi:hypothetical protein
LANLLVADFLERLPVDLSILEEDEAALADKPLLADRMAYHTKRLRVVCYVEGIEGVRLYKAKFPEAKPIQVKATTFAFQPKPEGYADFLCSLVDSWFQSDTALAATNRADVERLNQAVHPRRFNPDNHFTKPLSATLIGKLADVFAKHGHQLDTNDAKSMSKVRAAAKAAKGKRSAGRPFAKIGHITGDSLIVGNQSFRVEQHNGHACIRVIVGNSRVRLRLDALAAFVGLVGFEGDILPLSSIENRTGDLAPELENAPEADPLNSILPENWPRPDDQPELSLSGELAPDLSCPPSLMDRIAVLKPVQQLPPAAHADGADPLNL